MRKFLFSLAVASLAAAPTLALADGSAEPFPTEPTPTFAPMPQASGSAEPFPSPVEPTFPLLEPSTIPAPEPSHPEVLVFEGGVGCDCPAPVAEPTPGPSVLVWPLSKDRPRLPKTGN